MGLLFGLVEQDDSRDQLDGGKKISSKFIVACGNGSIVLDFVEKSLDEVAFAIEREITITLHLAVGLWRDHWSDCPLIERADQRIGVVSLVGEQRTRIGIFEQRLRTSQIMVLPWRQHQVDRIAQSVDQRMDFGGQSSARSADGLRAVFFRAPALC